MQPADDSALPPTGELSAEHRVIERVLHVLDNLISKSGTFEAAALRDCVLFFRLFADACHHGKEEDMLFPVLERHGMSREQGPIAVMLHEHTIGRRLVAGMAEALAAAQAGAAGAEAKFRVLAREYIELLSNHIWKEDNILFRMSEQILCKAPPGALENDFCQFRCKAFEGRRREELLALADRLEQQWSRRRDEPREPGCFTI